MKIKPGSFLLTSSVGGTDTNWRNTLLSRSILLFQSLSDYDGEVEFSHAEVITTREGHTFAARWRTREREPEKGLDAYIGAKVMIVEPAGEHYSLLKIQAAIKAMKERFDGDIYPVHRLLIQGLATFGPSFLVKINLFGQGICSEVAAYYGSQLGLFSYYNGMTPARLENDFQNRPSFFKIVFHDVFPGLAEYANL